MSCERCHPHTTNATGVHPEQYRCICIRSVWIRHCQALSKIVSLLSGQSFTIFKIKTHRIILTKNLERVWNIFSKLQESLWAYLEKEMLVSFWTDSQMNYGVLYNPPTSIEWTSSIVSHTHTKKLKTTAHQFSWLTKENNRQAFGEVLQVPLVRFFSYWHDFTCVR